MITIKETKTGTKCIFTYTEIINGTKVIERVCKIHYVRTQIKVSKNRQKEVFVFYNTDGSLNYEAYKFLNHNQKDYSYTTISNFAQAMKAFFIFCELFDIDMDLLSKDDMYKFKMFLAGHSFSDSELEINLLTKRKYETIKLFVVCVRQYLDYLGVASEVFEEKTSKLLYKNQTTTAGLMPSKQKDTAPEAISEEEFIRLINYIQEHEKSYEKGLEAISILSLMFLSGCRIGEVLGATVEDLEFDKDNKVGVLKIRNRYTDNRNQLAKRCMNINSRISYSKTPYSTKNVGFQEVYMHADSFELLQTYIQIAHNNARLKFTDNFKNTKADTVTAGSSFINHYIFLNTKGSILNYYSWNNYLKNLMEKCDIPIDKETKQTGLNHRFRHGFCTYLIKEAQRTGNLTLKQIKDLGRWKNDSSLLRYYNPTREEEIQMKEELQSEINTTLQLKQYVSKQCNDLFDIKKIIKK